jgi:two-component system LytT family response regulator
MMKVIIIDDEPLARNIVKEYLVDYPQIHIAQECGDGFEAVKAIAQHHPDLIFLDIQMPKINGFEMLELLENPPAVIFTTAYDEYAVRAFETHAVDYLLKPFSKERFDKSMQKWLSQKNTNWGANIYAALAQSAVQQQLNKNRIVVKINNNKIKIIPLQDIFFFEAADDYVKIHTSEGCYLKNKTMQYFETLLSSEQFVRTHRSYIVNVQYITKLDANEKDTYTAVLRLGEKVPVSKTGYAKLKQVLGL